MVGSPCATKLNETIHCSNNILVSIGHLLYPFAILGGFCYCVNICLISVSTSVRNVKLKMGERFVLFYPFTGCKTTVKRSTNKRYIYGLEMQRIIICSWKLSKFFTWYKEVAPTNLERKLIFKTSRNLQPQEYQDISIHLNA